MIVDNKYLQLASNYAQLFSGCTKVAVGSCVVKEGRVVALGANKSIPDLCKTRGCLRMELYGENSKLHRGAADCRAIHSEVDAVCNSGESLRGATIYVTRYPCEACARVIVSAGISRVVYGREQIISDMTLDIFQTYGIEVTHAHWFTEEDVWV